jgi:hypothetical protein
MESRTFFKLRIANNLELHGTIEIHAIGPNSHRNMLSHEELLEEDRVIQNFIDNYDPREIQGIEWRPWRPWAL